MEPYDVGLISATARVEGTQVSPVTFTAEATAVIVEFRSPRYYGYYAAFYGPCRCTRTVNTVTVPVGTPVEWKPSDGEPYAVTATSIPPGGIAFESETLRGNRFRFVPSVVGRWEYRDAFSGLTATLIAR